ncbi:hypothetical protein FRX31_005620 [Thalictrum thalictroides]|uniref:Uncharacterized protein n=1 Tax=Thalictrum thalictroides TaxID=46969 RepID=A0A7J6X8T4_THATH|nr:hypothetical protein FRX31_005620 [Thalictrum thalictroides]
MVRREVMSCSLHPTRELLCTQINGAVTLNLDIYQMKKPGNFVRKLFRDLEKCGRDVKKCGSLPLAIVMKLVWIAEREGDEETMEGKHNTICMVQIGKKKTYQG